MNTRMFRRTTGQKRVEVSVGMPLLPRKRKKKNTMSGARSYHSSKVSSGLKNCILPRWRYYPIIPSIDWIETGTLIQNKTRVYKFFHFLI